MNIKEENYKDREQTNIGEKVFDWRPFLFLMIKDSKDFLFSQEPPERSAIWISYLS